MRLIDADALEELFREVISNIAKRPEISRNLEHMVRASAIVICMIKDAPTIEQEPKIASTVDLINRADAMEAIRKRIFQIGYEDNPHVLSIQQAVVDVPAIEAERKKGKWVDDGCITKCSECGERQEFPHWQFCPNCGAYMIFEGD